MARRRIVKPAEERRRDLLDAARRLFVERGYEHTTMSMIASRAHVAQGTTYIYFSSKQEIFAAIVRELLAEIAGIIQSLAARTDLSAVDALRQAMDACLERISREARLVEAVLLNAQHALPAALAAEYVPQLLPSLAALIERGVREGCMRVTHPRLAADFLWVVGYRFLEAACRRLVDAGHPPAAGARRDLADLEDAFWEFALQALGVNERPVGQRPVPQGTEDA